MNYANWQPGVIPFDDVIANFQFEITDDGRLVYEFVTFDQHLTEIGLFVLVADEPNSPSDFVPLADYEPTPEAVAAFQSWLSGS